MSNFNEYSTRSDLKTAGKESLRGRWGLAVLVSLLISAITLFLNFFGPDNILISIASLILSPIISYSSIIFYYRMAQNEEVELTNIFDEFKYLGKVFGLSFLMGLIILLGLLLFIIPGIILSLSYSQAFYIMKDNEDFGIIDCLRESRRLMNGYKWEYFIFELSFLGWSIACIFTLGIGMLWLTPYMSVSCANFYIKLKECDSKELL